MGHGTGTTVNKTENDTDVLFDSYERCIRMEASAAAQGVTAPAFVTVGNTRGLAFDRNIELAFMTFHIPDDWDGASNIALEVGWYPESGDTLLDTETVKFNIAYHSVTPEEAIDNGTEATATATYTQSGAGTDKEHFETDITIPYTGGNQPLAKADDLFIQFIRDFDGDSYAGDAVVLYWNLCYTSNSIPELS